MIKKIISEGQTGADLAALDVAIKMGIAHGGWITYTEPHLIFQPMFRILRLQNPVTNPKSNLPTASFFGLIICVL